MKVPNYSNQSINKSINQSITSIYIAQQFIPILLRFTVSTVSFVSIQTKVEQLSVNSYDKMHLKVIFKVYKAISESLEENR